jgi:hypothetical protein
MKPTEAMRDLIKIVEADEPIDALDFFHQHCTFDDGVMRWKSNKAVAHHDIVNMASDAGLPVDFAKCEAGRAADKQEYAAARDRIKTMTGSTIEQLRDFKHGKRKPDTKLH